MPMKIHISHRTNTEKKNQIYNDMSVIRVYEELKKDHGEFDSKRIIWEGYFHGLQCILGIKW